MLTDFVDIIWAQPFFKSLAWTHLPSKCAITLLKVFSTVGSFNSHFAPYPPPLRYLNVSLISSLSSGVNSESSQSLSS